MLWIRESCESLRGQPAACAGRPRPQLTEHCIAEASGAVIRTCTRQRAASSPAFRIGPGSGIAFFEPAPSPSPRRGLRDESSPAEEDPGLGACKLENCVGFSPNNNMAAAFAVHLAGLFSRHKDSLSFAVPILLSGDMIYNYYYVSRLWRERCAEWRAEEQATMCFAMSGLCQRVVGACSKLEDQTWAAAMRRLQPGAAAGGSLPQHAQSREAQSREEATDFLSTLGFVTRYALHTVLAGCTI